MTMPVLDGVHSVSEVSEAIYTHEFNVHVCVCVLQNAKCVHAATQCCMLLY